MNNKCNNYYLILIVIRLHCNSNSNSDMLHCNSNIIVIEKCIFQVIVIVIPVIDPNPDVHVFLGLQNAKKLKFECKKNLNESDN